MGVPDVPFSIFVASAICVHVPPLMFIEAMAEFPLTSAADATIKFPPVSTKRLNLKLLPLVRVPPDLLTSIKSKTELVPKLSGIFCIADPEKTIFAPGTQEGKQLAVPVNVKFPFTFKMPFAEVKETPAPKELVIFKSLQAANPLSTDITFPVCTNTLAAAEGNCPDTAATHVLPL